MKKEIIELNTKEQEEIIKKLQNFEKRKKKVEIISFILDIFVSYLLLITFKKLAEITKEPFIMGMIYFISLTMFILLVKTVQLKQQEKELRQIVLDNERISKRLEEVIKNENKM